VSAIAIVHPSGLLGKELQETIARRSRQWREIRLLSTREEEVGGLTEVAGAAALVARYEPDSLRGASTVYFCGPVAANRPLFRDVPSAAVAVVLSTDATGDDGEPVVAGVNGETARPGRILLSPHPAVVLLAHLLDPLRDLEPRDVAATVILPASMADNAGLEELFAHTRQIVAMTERRPTPVFGAQLAFNLLPATTDGEALTALLRKVLGGGPRVSLHLLQGAVFHGVAASLHAGFAASPTVKGLRAALAKNPLLEMVGKARALGPIDAAAHEKVLLGPPSRDDAGAWLWAVMDNLTRGGALNALEIVEGLQ
jgi:aspartate-semialdehyde dehydrogenase